MIKRYEQQDELESPSLFRYFRRVYDLGRYNNVSHLRVKYERSPRLAKRKKRDKFRTFPADYARTRVGITRDDIKRENGIPVPS